MKKIFLILILMSNLFSLSSYQKKILNKTFEKAKAFDLSYTMTAIAWVESSLGKSLIRYNSRDCGIFQVNIKTLSNEKFKQDILCARLVLDYDFSFSVALERFKYFQNYWISKGYNKNYAWKLAIMSYHCGFNINRNDCKKYYKKIVKAIKLIKKERSK